MSLVMCLECFCLFSRLLIVEGSNELPPSSPMNQSGFSNPVLVVGDMFENLTDCPQSLSAHPFYRRVFVFDSVELLAKRFGCQQSRPAIGSQRSQGNLDLSSLACNNLLLSHLVVLQYLEHGYPNHVGCLPDLDSGTISSGMSSVIQLILSSSQICLRSLGWI